MANGDDSQRERKAERVTPEIQAAMDEYFFTAAGWTAGIGVAAGGVVGSILLWDHVHTASLVAWLVSTIICATIVVLVNSVSVFRRPVDSVGISLWVKASSGAVGLAYGCLLWIDRAAMGDTVALVSALALLFAISAGSVGGLAGIAGTGRYVMYPMWLMATTALFLGQQWVLAIATLVYLLIMGRDLGNTSSMLYEILSLREQSRSREVDAQAAAHRDPLTGLLNRAGLEMATAKIAATSTASVTAMFVDLDHFKNVNDRFGHLVGDHVLVEVADRLLQTLRPGDVVARLGGDEFLIVIDGDLDEMARQAISRSIISNLEMPFAIDNFEARISASIGVTVVAAAAFDLGAVQREADHAMYVAKGQGRRRTIRFDETVRSELEARSETETALRRAIQMKEIVAWAQPIVDLETETVVAVELLARWQREDGTFCPPGVFVPLAEEIGLIGDLGRQMLEVAGQTLAALQALPETATVGVSINVSPRQLADDAFVASVKSVIRRYKLAPGSLVVELTETVELHDLPEVRGRLAELVAIGTRLALDDFGSGYSSVQHLVGLPLEYVKLDGSLVKDLGRDPRQTALVRSIRDLASTLGRTVVVEGVETLRQAELLATLKMRYVQGFLFSRPKPVAEVVADLQNATPLRSLEPSDF